MELKMRDKVIIFDDNISKDVWWDSIIGMIVVFGIHHGLTHDEAFKFRSAVLEAISNSFKKYTDRVSGKRDGLLKVELLAKKGEIRAIVTDGGKILDKKNKSSYSAMNNKQNATKYDVAGLKNHGSVVTIIKEDKKININELPSNQN